MLRSYLLLLASLGLGRPFPLPAQGLQGLSVESRLPLPLLGDTLRLWHSYTTDSTIALLVSSEANPWLRRSYEFVIPLGRTRTAVLLAARLGHRDSLVISCTAGDYPSSGYYILLCRDRNGFVFSSEREFQLFRSGVERICPVPVRIEDKTDRRVVMPAAGPRACSYIYRSRELAYYPGCDHSRSEAAGPSE